VEKEVFCCYYVNMIIIFREQESDIKIA